MNNWYKLDTKKLNETYYFILEYNKEIENRKLIKQLYYGYNALGDKKYKKAYIKRIKKWLRKEGITFLKRKEIIREVKNYVQT